jgi:hypothetical protein
MLSNQLSDNRMRNGWKRTPLLVAFADAILSPDQFQNTTAEDPER